MLDKISSSGWKTAGNPQILTKGPNAGKWVVYVRDPDGNLLGLWEAKRPAPRRARKPARKTAGRKKSRR